jgi:hypothetical protein
MDLVEVAEVVFCVGKMATASAKKSSPEAATVALADPTIAEEKWTGPRRFMLGVVTLGIALTILDIIGGSATPH